MTWIAILNSSLQVTFPAVALYGMAAILLEQGIVSMKQWKNNDINKLKMMIKNT
jgi:hypothetical protein